MTYYCPKCNRFGLEWDSRAKMLVCCYDTCRHVIRINDSTSIPDPEIISNAIRNDGKGSVPEQYLFAH